ncbi:hypothetical protein FRB96_006516 [Tulasnella sp. 330]|nr:hypothetical protein FRB96_006516 [Tulasnella sp. 330]
MAQRTSAKQWTTAEDECLVQAVRTYGEDTESWKQIAAAVPGRTNKACRKRWKHSLHPSIKKSNWNVEEDELLLDLHMKHPGRWALIASHIPGRTDDACAKRYCEALDPKLNKNEWTPNEDEILLEAYDRLGSAWSKVGEELGRSGLGCRNRWRLLERRRKAVVRKAEKAKGGVSGSETRKRKRGAVSDPQLPDEEGADFEDQEPGPNKSRLSPAIRRWESSPPIPSGSGSRPPPNPSPVLAVQNPVDVPSHNTTTHTNPHTSIDPSIISMALGKCGCGCASGANPCMCSSITPALSFDLASSSIDWNELFPYLHAELPNVFVEPLLHWDVGNSQQKAYMQAISTLLAENAEGGQCRFIANNHCQRTLLQRETTGSCELLLNFHICGGDAVGCRMLLKFN